MAEEKMNLYQKIVEVRKSVGKINKDSTAGKGSKFTYQYVSESQILSRISEQMNDLNLLLIPNIISKKYEKEGNQYTVELDLMYKWIDGDSPQEVLEIPYYAVGQQTDPSKAYGTALTYANRYFLLKMFNLATDEDDADAKPQKTQQRKQQYPNRQHQETQDKGKVALVQQNARDLSDIINSSVEDESKKTTTDQIINAYLEKVGSSNIQQTTNDQLINMSQLIKQNIAKYDK